MRSRSRYTTISGIVLRRRSRPNGDALVTLLSPAGKRVLLARAGKSSAGNAGRLSLFNDVTVQYYLRREDALPIVTQVSLNGMLTRLSEPDLYPLAHVLAELADVLSVDVHHGEPLHDYLASGFRGLVRHPDPEKVTLSYAWALLRLAGLSPDGSACGRCGSSAALCSLDIPEGFLLCAACSSGPLPDGELIRELQVLAAGLIRPALELGLADRTGHWRLLNRWLDRHVDRLKSSQGQPLPVPGAAAGA